jgi:hypothetical protein
VENRFDAPPLLAGTWPTFAAELTAALGSAGEGRLARQVDRLRVVEVCGCGDDFCQSFRTGPKPSRTYGDGHRNVSLVRPPLC